MEFKSKKTLRQLRRERDITQQELANLTEITTRMISLYENDINVLRAASFNNLEKIAKALNVEVKDIFLG